MKNTAFTGILLVSLVLMVVVGLLYLFSTGEGPVLRVTTSRGASGVESGTVLLPGDPVETGDRVRVGSAPLTGVFSGSTRVRFNGASRFRHRGFPLGPRSLHLSVGAGEGVVRADGTRVVLGFRNRTVLVDGGTVRWILGKDRIDVRFAPEAELYRIKNGETIPVDGPVRTNQYTILPAELDPHWPENPHPLEDYEEYSVIRPGRSVLKALLTQTREGKSVRSLLEVFGHWVRDRWGNVYLYEREDRVLQLRSPGPDEGLFTQDDRTWSERLSR